MTIRHGQIARYNNEKAESPLPHYGAVGLYALSALSTLVAPVVIVSFKHRSDSVLEDFRQTSRKSVDAKYIIGNKSPCIAHYSKNIKPISHDVLRTRPPDI